MSAVKVIEIIGVSEKGWVDAIGDGVRKAAMNIDNISGVKFLGKIAKVKNGEFTSYKANLSIVFGLTDLVVE